MKQRKERGDKEQLKVNQSHYRPEVSRGFEEVKVPRLRGRVYPQEIRLVLISVRG